MKNLLWNKNTPKPLPLSISQNIRDSHVTQSILTYLQMKTNGALMLTGEWGSGKTYFVENFVFPIIREIGQFKPILIALYGVDSASMITHKIIASDSAISESLLNTMKSLTALGKLIKIPDEVLFQSLNLQNKIICFDDIERMSDKYKINDFLGLVNELVEKKNCKVLLIANESKIREQKDIFKEKTIEKTIHFVPDMDAVFDNIINSYSKPFKEYLIKNKTFILQTLTPKLEGNEVSEELKKDLSNIRTLKFAIEHFKYAFEILIKGKNIEGQLIQIQLRNIWFFTLSISIEFKKPDSITFNDKKGLVNFDPSVANFNLGELDIYSDTVVKGPLDNPNYTDSFYEKYYKGHSEKYIFYSQIYDLITSSKTISEQDFLYHLEQSFNVENGKIKPAHEILNKFMPHLGGGYWSFTDVEFKKALNQLLEYVDKGELDDITSYFNAGVYFRHFPRLS